MAIYHLNVSSIGRTTHKVGTAGAHARYIMRQQAASLVEAHHMPDNGNAARAWLNQVETTGRKNGRVLTKIRLALPRELDHAQNVAAARDFMAEITQGHRVPAAFAVHDIEGNDRENPHVHIVIHDKDVETGKRVCKFSEPAWKRKQQGLEPNAVEHARKLWEQTANRHLELAGMDERVDRRTLVAQDVDRQATIHEGVRAQALDKKQERPVSQDREVVVDFHRAQNAGDAYHRRDDDTKTWLRKISYAEEIDQGETRVEYNARIARENEARQVEQTQAAERRAHLEQAHRQAVAKRDAAATSPTKARGDFDDASRRPDRQSDPPPKSAAQEFAVRSRPPTTAAPDFNTEAERAAEHETEAQKAERRYQERLSQLERQEAERAKERDRGGGRKR